jgi:hypothetical protein
MNYAHSFLFCKSCRRTTLHTCREAEHDGERRKKYRCSECDTESSRPLNEIPKQRA